MPMEIGVSMSRGLQLFTSGTHIPFSSNHFQAAYSFTGAVSFLSTTFAALSDVVPSEYRAATYGLLLSGYFGGYSLAPTMAIILSSDTSVALFSLVFSFIAFFVAFCFLPETLPDEVRIENANLQMTRNSEPVASTSEGTDDIIVVSSTDDVPRFRFGVIWMWHAATRPLREISILYRNRTLQLVSLGSLCSAMVYAIDTTLVIYYIEEMLNVQKSDIAIMTLALGIAGILIQGGLVQPITATLGEKGALILAFACGILHNFLYGSARTKYTIYAALILSQLTKINIPLLSSCASKEVDAHEQGRVQGALFAINAIGNAVGPVLVEFIYHHRSTAKLGQGSMFIYASIIYAIGTVVVSFLPDRPADSPTPRMDEPLRRAEELEEPLLNPSEIVDDVDSGNAPVV
jgi:Na+/melibiose symporter-like transporter